MKFTTKLLSAAVITAAMFQPSLAQPAFAQQAYTSGQTNPPAAAQAQQQQGKMVEITQTDIENYANARMAVDKIGNKWRGKVKNMSAAEQKELNSKLVSVVQDSGLSIQEYNTISAALQQNEELQQRIIQAMQEG